MTHDEVSDDGDAVCRFCKLALDADEVDVGWHFDCANARDDDVKVDSLPSHPMYGMFGNPIGYQQG